MLTAEEKKIVKKARMLISPAKRWTQDEFAVTRKGRTVDRDRPEAVKFCAVGTLWRAAYVRGHDLQGDQSCEVIARRIADKVSPRRRMLEDVNDGKDGHRKVLALFDKALAE